MGLKFAGRAGTSADSIRKMRGTHVQVGQQSPKAGKCGIGTSGGTGILQERRAGRARGFKKRKQEMSPGR